MDDAMTPCIPPSEAELDEMLDGGLLDSKQAARLITEIRRLRALCGRAAEDQESSAHWVLLRAELRAASKGKV